MASHPLETCMCRNRLLPVSSIILMIGAKPILLPAATAMSSSSARPKRPAAPARDPHTPGFVSAKELPDAAVPPADADGNFIIGPTHTPASEMTAAKDVPQGTVFE